ncbi:MAG: hypothetical protein ACXVDB_06470 [Tumebacillaceae bacterium]
MKLFKLNSPVGIALTLAGVVLALSPEARKATRKLVVKGTAALLGTVDSVKEATTGAMESARSTMVETQQHLIEPMVNTVTHAAADTTHVVANTMEQAGAAIVEGTPLHQ